MVQYATRQWRQSCDRNPHFQRARLQLFSTPGENAEFDYAKVEPWAQSVPAMCYKNIDRYCEAFPEEYEPIYVYSIYDKGSYYELEPHALVKKRGSKQVTDITPTVEVLAGKPTLPKICYVKHSTLQQLINGAKNSIRLQYLFLVVKKKTKGKSAAGRRR